MATHIWYWQLKT